MRVYLFIVLAGVLAATAGCDGGNYQSQGEAAGASRGAFLYPLSTPPPAPVQPQPPATMEYQAATPGYVTPYTTVAQPGAATTPYPVTTTYSGTTTYPVTTTYATPPVGSGSYCVVEPSYTSPVINLPDPPVVIENQYYPSAPAPQPYAGTVSYTTTTVSAVGPAPSPYDPLYGYQPAPAALVPTYGAPETIASMTSPLDPGVSSYRLVPAPDIPPGIHPNDAGPSQWFEIVRPGNGPIRIGRVSATCVCVGVRVPNRHVGAGERALIEARTLTRPPSRNLTYGMFVNIEEPEKIVLDADVTLP